MTPIIDPSDWPEFGDVVRVTRYAKGSTLVGDHDGPVFEDIGTVMQTPRSGSKYLLVKTEHVPDRVACSDLHWTITPDYVFIEPSGLWKWTIETAPGKGKALMITVLVNPQFVDPEMIKVAVRGTLRGLGVTVLPHSYEPDPDTVADCADVPEVTLLNITR